MFQATTRTRLAVPHLRAWRLRKGYSQRELSRLSGVAKTTIIQLEAGRARANFATLGKLAQALGVTREQVAHMAPERLEPSDAAAPADHRLLSRRREGSGRALHARRHRAPGGARTLPTLAPATPTDATPGAPAQTPLAALPDARWSALAQATGQIIWSTPPDGQVVDLPYWRAYTGQTVEQCRGWGWLDAVHPADRARAQAAWEQAVATKTPYQVLYQIRRADGEYRPFSVRGVPVMDDAGGIQEWVGACTDITDQVALEFSVRSSERKFRAIFEQAESGIALMSLDGYVRHANAYFCALLGYSAAELERLTYLDITYPDDRKLNAEMVQELLAGRRESFELEKRYLRKDGGRVWVSLHTTLLTDDHGEPDYLLTVAQDISVRKAEQSHERERLDALLAMAEALALPAAPPAHSPEAEATQTLAASREAQQRVVELTQRVLDGRYTSVALIDLETDAMQPLAVVGLTPEREALWWRIIAHARFGDYVSAERRDQITAGGAWQGAVSDDRAQQTEYFGVQWVLGVTAPLDARRLVLVSVESRDGKPFSEEQIELAQAATRLVTLVLERDRLLRQRMATQALEAANERMRTFLGVAGHELRTPVTSVKASVQLAARLVRASRDESAREGGAASNGRLLRAQGLLEKADDQASRLNRLITDLLDVTRIEQGKLELHREPGDLAAIVREMVEAQQLIWPDRALSLAIEPGVSFQMRLDGDRIGQVVTNLLTNALKYSADGPVAVRVERREEGAEAQARVAVTDQGPGLSAEAQARLWEPFYQAPNASEAVSRQGLGLGLFICKSIVERHGGRIGVQSVVGEGSTFWFELPMG